MQPALTGTVALPGPSFSPQPRESALSNFPKSALPTVTFRRSSPPYRTKDRFSRLREFRDREFNSRVPKPDTSGQRRPRLSISGPRTIATRDSMPPNAPLPRPEVPRCRELGNSRLRPLRLFRDQTLRPPNPEI
jgi:hypothetical protein